MALSLFHRGVGDEGEGAVNKVLLGGRTAKQRILVGFKLLFAISQSLGN